MLSRTVSPCDAGKLSGSRLRRMMKLKDHIDDFRRDALEFEQCPAALEELEVNETVLRLLIFHDKAVKALRHYAEREYHSTTHPDAFIQCEAASVLADLEKEIFVPERARASR
jgi:hypothetical protein